MSWRHALWGVGLLLAMLLAAAATLLVFRKFERDYLADLEHTMAVTGQTLAEAPAPLNEGHRAAIQDMIEKVQNTTGSRIRVFGENREVLADSFGWKETQGELRFRPEVVEAFGGRYGAYTRFADESARSLALYVAIPVVREGKVAGVVYVSHSTDSVLQRLGGLRRTLRVVLAVVATVAFVATLLVLGSIHGTLQRIREASRQISGGHLDRRVEVGGRDEVADIADHFNTLAASLQAKVGELEEERDRTKQFIADISHELKTPITGLSGSVDALLNGASEDRQMAARFLGNIRHDADRLAALVSDLLELQKLEYYQVRAESFDLGSLVEKVAAQYEAQPLPLLLHLPAGGALALADASKIQRVLENLVENALRFSPADGNVTVEVAEEGERFRVTVADQGPGIAPAEQSQIFERFFGGNKVGGAGLGLSIAKEIVSKHGESIGVNSENGQGSRFYFTVKRLDLPGGRPVTSKGA